MSKEGFVPTCSLSPERIGFGQKHTVLSGVLKKQGGSCWQLCVLQEEDLPLLRFRKWASVRVCGVHGAWALLAPSSGFCL